MLPDNDELLNDEIEISIEPSKTYKLNRLNIFGSIDGIEAIEQAIYKILNTERYEYEIYSFDYGIETKDLFGMPVDFVIASLPRRVTEALTNDDRILSCDNFSFSKKKGKVSVSFTAHTTLGDLQVEKEVEYANI